MRKLDPRNCELCGEPFQPLSSKRGRFCNPACFARSRVAIRIACQCRTCGKPMSVLPQRLEDGRGRYCSASCRNVAPKMRKRPVRPPRTETRHCQRCSGGFTVEIQGGVRNETRFCSNRCRYEGRGSALVDYVTQRIGTIESNGCRYWTGSRHDNGYGRVRVTVDGLSDALAHRIVYMLHHSMALPSDIKVCHTCDNGPLGCVEITHLFAGTQADNMADMAAKGRSNRGEKNPTARLTAFDVIAIRSLDGQIRRAEIGRRFGVSRSHVSAILGRKLWKHLA